MPKISPSSLERLIWGMCVCAELVGDVSTSANAAVPVPMQHEKASVRSLSLPYDMCIRREGGREEGGKNTVFPFSPQGLKAQTSTLAETRHYQKRVLTENRHYPSTAVYCNTAFPTRLAGRNCYNARIPLGRKSGTKGQYP